MLNTAVQLLSTNKFDGLKDKIFPSDVIVIGGFRINDSVISGFIVVFVILLAALILRLTVIRHWKTTPTAAQMFLEWLVSFFDKSADEMTEKYSGLMGPYTLGAERLITSTFRWSTLRSILPARHCGYRRLFCLGAVHLCVYPYAGLS